MRTCLLATTALVLALLTGCSPKIEQVPAPEGMQVHLDQSRIKRQTREVFLLVNNPTDEPLRVGAFRLTSARFDAVDQPTDVTIDPGYERVLKLQLPQSRCGTDLDGQVQLVYRVGDGDEVRSKLAVDDQYGTVGLAMDRDCALSRLQDAADLDIGSPTTAKVDAQLTLTLPVTLTPTGKVTDVSFDGYESTVLFNVEPAPGRSVALEGAAKDVPLTLVPARCDAHALAEDKVGTLIGVRVKADGLPEGTSFYLPISASTRAALHDFYADACGLR